MSTILRLADTLLSRVRADLNRPHEFAHERVGFIACRAAPLSGSGLLLVAFDYHGISDDDYVDDLHFGALMGSRAIRRALQYALTTQAGMFHIHRHEHAGPPGFSSVDLQESAKFVPDFFKVAPFAAHGAIVLSRDSIAARVWTSPRAPQGCPPKISSVGTRLQTWEKNDGTRLFATEFSWS